MSDQVAKLFIDGAASFWSCWPCQATTTTPCVDWVGLIDTFKEHIVSDEHLRSSGFGWMVGHINPEGWVNE